MTALSIHVIKSTGSVLALPLTHSAREGKLLGYSISSSFNFILDEMELVKPVVICDSELQLR